MRHTAWLFASFLSAASAAASAEAPAVVREEVGNRISENVPAVPPELSERLAAYQNTRGANFAGWLP
ncbi:MAG TPA: hypothetical protein VFO79_07525, partial [Xanthomonadales bacterium]|nr:hypothetical protein [Xanthomonadales bacterium]